MLIGAGQQWLLGQVGHVLAVGGDAARGGLLAGVLGGAVVPTGDPHAGHQSPQITGVIPVQGRRAKSSAMIAAAPRRKA